MNAFIGLLLLFFGFLQMAFGIYIFYALLPLWYGIFGGYLGYALGQSIFGIETASMSNITWGLVVFFGGLLAYTSYSLELYKRYFIGGLIGLTLGLLTTTAFAITGLMAVIITILSGLVFAFFVQISYDPLIIIGSSLSGAAFVLDGFYLLTGWMVFNRFNEDFIPVLVWAGFGILGFFLQRGELKVITHTDQRIQTHAM